MVGRRGGREKVFFLVDGFPKGHCPVKEKLRIRRIQGTFSGTNSYYPENSDSSNLTDIVTTWHTWEVVSNKIFFIFDIRSKVFFVVDWFYKGHCPVKGKIRIRQIPGTFQGKNSSYPENSDRSNLTDIVTTWHTLEIVSTKILLFDIRNRVFFLVNGF